MNKKKAYDLPIRIFHWLFATLFVFSFGVAKVIDDDSTLYSYHMLSGIVMIFLITLRVIWGIIGSRHAKLSSFRLSPLELVEYFRSILSSKSKRYLGHNPASSYAAVGMLMFTLGLGVTGILMSKGIGAEFFEEVHELCAAGFMITVILHIGGVALHHIKHRDGLAFSMISGVKDDVKGEKEIESNHPFIAILFIGLIISFAVYLNQNYDPNTQELNLFGVQLELSEHEDDEHYEHEHDD